MRPIDQIESDIRAAIERARAEGWRIKGGLFARSDSYPRECCALGAIAVSAGAVGSAAFPGFVCERLKVGPAWVWAFAAGFDGEGEAAEWRDPAAYDLGRRLREEYVRE